MWSDAGYQGVDKRAENRELEVAWLVAMRPGKRRQLEPGSHEALAEGRKASVRAKVEHPFLYVKWGFGYAKVRYRGLHKNTQRLRGAVGAATRLEEVDDGGHLIVSIRRAQGGGGWEMLVRISPMPLSARRWRVCNRADAANAAIARAMAGWAGAAHGERFLNLCSGSGTILIERALMGGAASVVGVEIDAAALACAEANMRAAGVRGGVHLIRGDARNAPLRSASFDAAAADLPFGMVADTAEGLDALYDATLDESARLVVGGGAFVALTARRRLFEAALSRHARRWSRAAEARLRVSRRGGHIAPSLYLLRRL